MRSASLLLVGLSLLGGGIGVLMSDLPGRWWLGITLIVAGLLVKVGGLLLTDDPARTRPGTRTVLTLDGREVEVPRAGVPVGRSAALRRTGPSRVQPAASVRTTPADGPPRPAAAPIRRAS